MLEAGECIWGADASNGEEEVKEVSYSMTSKGSSVGSKNRNPRAMLKHCRFSRFSTTVAETNRAAAAMLCSDGRCMPAMFSVRCDGTSRGSASFS